MEALKLYAIKIDQPFGSFFLTKLSAETLLKVAYSTPMRPTKENEWEFQGNQRVTKQEKLKQIGDYIDSVEAAFPNNIILAANYSEDGHIVEDEKLRWTVEKSDHGLYLVTIPALLKIASIVDGQHRLFGFEHIHNAERLGLELPCAIYFDLPVSYQAYIFSTINHNQTPVSKSLSYILYGYNLENEKPNSWSPDKLAVYISRNLNSSEDSPFYRKIKIAPQIDKILIEKAENDNWTVSIATIVDGILQLISDNPKRDRDILGQTKLDEGRERSALKISEDKSPLRDFYLEGQDIVVLKAVQNYFTAVSKNLYSTVGDGSFLKKTVGIQALLDFLKEEINTQQQKIKRDPEMKLNLSLEYFLSIFNKLNKLDFNEDYFKISSAKGRQRIRNKIFYNSGIFEKTTENDHKSVYENPNTNTLFSVENDEIKYLES
jgi:DNA phosphorothioation-associated DGQHR protein 1